MPLLLLAIPATLGGLWFFNKEIEKAENLAIKGAIIGAVGYVAWTQRHAIARAFKG